MLKKIGTMLLVLVMIVGLAACGGSPAPEPQPEPAELAFASYSHILEQLSIEAGQSGAYDIDMVIVMDMTAGGETFHIITSGNMRMIVDGDAMQAAVVMETDMGDFGSVTMELYIAALDGELTESRMVIDGEEIPTELLPFELMEEIFEDLDRRRADFIPHTNELSEGWRKTKKHVQESTEGESATEDENSDIIQTSGVCDGNEQNKNIESNGNSGRNSIRKI